MRQPLKSVNMINLCIKSTYYLSQNSKDMQCITGNNANITINTLSSLTNRKEFEQLCKKYSVMQPQRKFQVLA